jgi:hypothetical protein
MEQRQLSAGEIPHRFYFLPFEREDFGSVSHVRSF